MSEFSGKLLWVLHWINLRVERNFPGGNGFVEENVTELRKKIYEVNRSMKFFWKSLVATCSEKLTRKPIDFGGRCLVNAFLKMTAVIYIDSESNLRFKIIDVLEWCTWSFDMIGANFYRFRAISSYFETKIRSSPGQVMEFARYKTQDQTLVTTSLNLS